MCACVLSKSCRTHSPTAVVLVQVVLRMGSMPSLSQQQAALQHFSLCPRSREMDFSLGVGYHCQQYCTCNRPVGCMSAGKCILVQVVTLDFLDWWGQSGSKMAQNRFMLVQVPQDEAKLVSRWPPNRYVLASWSFFHNLLPELRFPMFFAFQELWEHQFL